MLVEVEVEAEAAPVEAGATVVVVAAAEAVVVVVAAAVVAAVVAAVEEVALPRRASTGAPPVSDRRCRLDPGR
jgi:hypothetical protein